MVKKASHKHDELICQVFDLNPEATLLLDIKGKVLKANSQVQVLTGYKIADLEGKSIFSLPFMPKKSLSIINKNFLKRLDGKKIAAYDIEIKTNNGDVLIGSVLAQVLKDKNGLPKGLVVVVENVTRQRQLTQELHELQKRTEKYLDISGSMIIVLGKKGEVKLINRVGLGLLGYKSKEILNKNWFDLVVSKEIKSEIKEVFAKVMSGKEDIVSKYENEILAKNGNKLLISWSNTALKGSDGQVIELVSSGLDITTERKDKKSLREAREMLSLVMEHSSEVYYMNSVTYDRLDYISDQCVQMMGYSKEELMKDWTIVLSDSPANQKAIESTKKAIETGEKQPIYLMEIKTKKGVLKTTEVDEFPIKNNEGIVTGLSGVVRDISKRVEMEKKLTTKVDQFESMNKIVVGRELKMIELKEKISKLESKLKGSKNEKK